MKRLAVLLIAAVALALTACVPLKPPAPPAAPAVVVWGDSFGESVAPYLNYDERVFGGTAPCDWTANVQQTVAAGQAPRTAVLVFVGNKHMTCNYEVAARNINALLTAFGTRTLWVAAPPLSNGADVLTNAAYARAGVPVIWSPAFSVGAGYRGPDGLHLNTEGAQRFANAIRQEVGA